LAFNALRIGLSKISKMTGTHRSKLIRSMTSICLCLITAAFQVNAQATLNAQDTLKLSLPQALQLFIQNNYQLIARQYQVEQAKADVITAKLFDNPQISYENVLYNPDTRKFLQTDRVNGQFQASLSQMIRLAGKRNKNIQLAGLSVKMAAYAYYDLMRTLKFTLSSAYSKAYYDQQSAQLYARQISSLQTLLGANEQQLKLGNVAAKEVLRIKSLLYTLQAEYSSLQNEIEDGLTEVRLMTGIKPEIPIQLQAPGTAAEGPSASQLVYTSLLDSARSNRADLQLARTAVTYAEKNLSLQKANAVPDIELSLTYDLQGSYIQRYNGIGISMPIPLFNRNQGEIRKARIAADAGNAALKQQENELENEVHNSFLAVLRTEKLYQGIDKNFSADFDRLIVEVVRNFKNRNISLIEFLDFYDSYKNNTLQLNKMRYERMNARQEINFVTGTAVFK